ncbi:RICIN domain-containing protein [Paenibacillus sp. 1P07SE]|uniref:RICIN domain-containing protein n=1 Tax=Paenibacillus sp. 1P07SE TaxID=3132209 RepID=UPI0039A63EDD
MLKKFVLLSVLLTLLVGQTGGVGGPHSIVHAANLFVHPGLLHTQVDFTRMTQMVNAGTQPYLDGWHQLVNSPLSSSGWTPRATSIIVRGGEGANNGLLHTDAARAYQTALRWKISGSTAHGDTARDILNAWSSTLTAINGNADRYLAAGLQGYQLANAAEIMRGYPGFHVTQMQDMLLDVFYKQRNELFLLGNEYGVDHNGAYIQNYWANWDLSNMAATVAIGIFCDRRDIYDIGLEYFKHGLGNGSIYNAIPYLHPNGLAQWQESGRDQPHTLMGVGLMAAIAEMAWNQGDDLYGWANNRLMRAAEYVARYNIGSNTVPFSTYEWGSGVNGSVQTQTVISDSGRYAMRPIWEMLYNHYANRKGLSVPNIAAAAGMTRPEGGPVSSSPSSFDELGFGTLLYTRPPGGGGSAVLPQGNIPDGTYRFVLRLDGKVMEAAGTSDGAVVRKSTYTGSANQHWNVTHLGGGQYSVRNAQSGRALDVASASHLHSASFIIWNYSGADNQRFAFLPTGGGYYRITPAHSNKPVDVPGSSTAEGVALKQWRYILGSNQQWQLVPVP